MIYAILRDFDVPGFGDLEVLGDDNKVIVTFDITGIGPAVNADAL